jgi:DeoR/GlpR family transcriptional regulator of sugar metabolism
MLNLCPGLQTSHNISNIYWLTKIINSALVAHKMTLQQKTIFFIVIAGLFCKENYSFYIFLCHTELSELSVTFLFYLKHVAESVLR